MASEWIVSEPALQALPAAPSMRTVHAGALALRTKPPRPGLAGTGLYHLLIIRHEANILHGIPAGGSPVAGRWVLKGCCRFGAIAVVAKQDCHQFPPLELVGSSLSSRTEFTVTLAAAASPSPKPTPSLGPLCPRSTPPATTAPKAASTAPAPPLHPTRSIPGPPPARAQPP